MKTKPRGLSRNKAVSIILELDAHYKTIERYWMNWNSESGEADLDQLDWSLSQALDAQEDIDEASKLIERLKELCETAMRDATKQAENLLHIKDVK